MMNSGLSLDEYFGCNNCEFRCNNCEFGCSNCEFWVTVGMSECLSVYENCEFVPGWLVFDEINLNQLILELG